MKTTHEPTPQQVSTRRDDVRSKWSDADAEQRRRTAQRRQAELLAQLTASLQD